MLHRKIEITSHRNRIIKLLEHVDARKRYIKTAHIEFRSLEGGGGELGHFHTGSDSF